MIMKMFNREEIEANKFALSLLMPEHVVFNELKKIKQHDSKTIIKILSKKFQVTKSIVVTRLLNMGILTSI